MDGKPVGFKILAAADADTQNLSRSHAGQFKILLGVVGISGVLHQYIHTRNEGDILPDVGIPLGNGVFGGKAVGGFLGFDEFKKVCGGHNVVALVFCLVVGINGQVGVDMAVDKILVCGRLLGRQIKMAARTAMNIEVVMFPSIHMCAPFSFIFQF